MMGVPHTSQLHRLINIRCISSQRLLSDACLLSHSVSHTMSDVIRISVDGQDGDLVARNSGIRFVTPDDDLALVRVCRLRTIYCHCKRVSPLIYALLTVLVSCFP